MPIPEAAGAPRGLFPARTVFPSLWFQDPAMWGEQPWPYLEEAPYWFGVWPGMPIYPQYLLYPVDPTHVGPRPTRRRHYKLIRVGGRVVGRAAV